MNKLLSLLIVLLLNSCLFSHKKGYPFFDIDKYKKSILFKIDSVQNKNDELCYFITTEKFINNTILELNALITQRSDGKISYEVDERLDPLLATEASAKLLSRNFKGVSHWPLAITAYNSGLSGIKRAVRGLFSLADRAATSKSRWTRACSLTPPGNGTVSNPVPQTADHCRRSPRRNRPSAARCARTTSSSTGIIMPQKPV